jgi:predicted DNA-binding protein
VAFVAAGATALIGCAGDSKDSVSGFREGIATASATYANYVERGSELRRDAVIRGPGTLSVDYDKCRLTSTNPDDCMVGVDGRSEAAFRPQSPSRDFAKLQEYADVLTKIAVAEDCDQIEADAKEIASLELFKSVPEAGPIATIGSIGLCLSLNEMRLDALREATRRADPEIKKLVAALTRQIGRWYAAVVQDNQALIVAAEQKYLAASGTVRLKRAKEFIAAAEAARKVLKTPPGKVIERIGDLHEKLYAELKNPDPSFEQIQAHIASFVEYAKTAFEAIEAIRGKEATATTAAAKPATPSLRGSEEEHADA